MKVVLFGASGSVGKLVVLQAFVPNRSGKSSLGGIDMKPVYC